MKKEIIKPFDLEAYKNGAKVKIRNGHEVRIVCTDVKNQHYPIAALVKLDDGSEAYRSYNSEGKFLPYKSAISNDDLVIVEEVEEPKFKVGDFVKHGDYPDDTYIVKSVDLSSDYELDSVDGKKGKHIAKATEDVIRLWDVTKDAKDGDVIYSRHNTESFEWMGIFKSLDKENKVAHFYGFWHNMFKTFTVCRNEAFVLYDDFYPATKEQRDKLEKAMADAGYTFDFEKKELKKIVAPKFNIGDVICDKSCTTLNKEAQPNLEIVDIRNGMYICDKGSFQVSQQDEYVLVGKKIDSKLNDYSVSNELRTASFAHAKKEILNHTFPSNEEFELAYTFEEGAKWQAARKSSWSKDDDDNIGMIESRLIDLLSYTREDNSLTKRRKNSIKEEVVGYINWLTSLEDRSTWKPSDEQMDALEYHLKHTNENSWLYKETKKLYEQLKKLK